MKIGIVGVGNMGHAFAKALGSINVFSESSIYLFERNEKQSLKLKKEQIGRCFTEITNDIADCDIILLAVKPQGFNDLASDLANKLGENPLIISIMAGVPISVIESALNSKLVVRAMPNTPCQLGKGITGYYMPDSINSQKEEVVKLILGSTGDTIKVDKEELVDSVTAISGSGPAYFYYFLKHIVQAGVDMGLKQEDARTLANQTMQGAHHLIKESNQSFDDLITAVKSKGGTTEAALNTLEEKSVGDSIEIALVNAKKRAKELSEMVAKGE